MNKDELLPSSPPYLFLEVYLECVTLWASLDNLAGSEEMAGEPVKSGANCVR